MFELVIGQQLKCVVVLVARLWLLVVGGRWRGKGYQMLAWCQSKKTLSSAMLTRVLDWGFSSLGRLSSSHSCSALLTWPLMVTINKLSCLHRFYLDTFCSRCHWDVH